VDDRPNAAGATDDRRYPSRPFVGVGAVVFKGDHVLLIRRGRPPRQGQWSLPGGLQRSGETVFEAGVREVREETGLTVEPVALIDVVDSITRDERGRAQYHYTLVDILAEWRAGDAVAGDDAAAVAWTTLDDLARFALWSETERIIRLAARRRG
jgi:ADP-ribose pyrophosphatase YjhB (NUDIX family)